MTGLVPNRQLFDFELPLRRLDRPVLTADPVDWDQAYRLPDLCLLDGQTSFAPVYAAWSEDGLWIATHVQQKRRPLKCDPSEFWNSDHLRLCVDTRDARTNRRATRYCHMFYLLPSGGGDSGGEAVGGSHEIRRARETAPAATQGAIQVTSRIQGDGYALEALIGAQALNGFNPSDHPRIGLYYMLEDRDLGQQYMTVGDDLYWYIDPSTWATAVLK